MTNVTPRYARLKSNSGKNEVIGWENIELISDRPLEVMLSDFKRLKEEFPDRYMGLAHLLTNELHFSTLLEGHHCSFCPPRLHCTLARSLTKPR